MIRDRIFFARFNYKLTLLQDLVLIFCTRSSLAVLLHWSFLSVMASGQDLPMGEDGGDSMQQKLAAYESRLSALERRVSGQVEPGSAKQKFSCLDRVVSIDSRMKAATKANRENIRSAWTQLDELEQWMKVVMTHNLSDSAKADVILAQEGSLLNTAEQLSEISELKDALNPEPLSSIPTVSARLKPLIPVHLEQVEKSGELQGGVRHLLASYNQVLSMLSDQFVALDGFVTELEKQKQEAGRHPA